MVFLWGFQEARQARLADDGDKGIFRNPRLALECIYMAINVGEGEEERGGERRDREKEQSRLFKGAPNKPRPSHERERRDLEKERVEQDLHSRTNV